MVDKILSLTSVPFLFHRRIAKEKLRMNSSNCFSINKTCPIPFPNNPSFSTHSNIKPPRSSINNNNLSPKQEFQEPKIKQKPIKRQPTILEVEKAIDAGTFRDSDPNRKSVENVKSLQSMLRSPFEKNESYAEKQLRQTGEWIDQKAERRLRSASWSTLYSKVQHVHIRKAISKANSCVLSAVDVTGMDSCNAYFLWGCKATISYTFAR